MATTYNMRYFKTELDIPDFRDAFREEEEDFHAVTWKLLTYVGEEVVRFLREYTTKMRPPDYRVTYHGGDPKAKRPAHPGGWADISRDMRKKYRYTLELVDDGWELQIVNWSEHAIFVEAMDGFFVVTGVMAENGPVHRAIRRAVRRIAPEMAVQFTPGKAPERGDTQIESDIITVTPDF